MKEKIRADPIVEIIDEGSLNFVNVFRRALSRVTQLSCLPPVEHPTEAHLTRSFPFEVSGMRRNRSSIFVNVAIETAEL